MAINESDSVSIADDISHTYGISFADSIAIVDAVKLAYPIHTAVTIARLAVKRLGIARMPSTRIHEEKL